MTDDNPTDERCNDLRMSVCRNGVINVRNEVSGSGENHSVFLGDDGAVLRCSCKGHKFNGHCYHETAVENSPLVVSSATAASASYSAEVVTDGGTFEGTSNDEADMRCDECGHEWREDDEGTHCPDCGSTERRPRRTERADFGGGETTGVVDL